MFSTESLVKIQFWDGTCIRINERLAKAVEFLLDAGEKGVIGNSDDTFDWPRLITELRAKGLVIACEGQSQAQYYPCCKIVLRTKLRLVWTGVLIA